nr:MAG TPA_asm: hypothetical protein [Caudoviricetes sp.]
MGRKNMFRYSCRPHKRTVIFITKIVINCLIAEKYVIL